MGLTIIWHGARKANIIILKKIILNLTLIFGMLNNKKAFEKISIKFLKPELIGLTISNKNT